MTERYGAINLQEDSNPDGRPSLAPVNDLDALRRLRDELVVTIQAETARRSAHEEFLGSTASQENDQDILTEGNSGEQ